MIVEEAVNKLLRDSVNLILDTSNFTIRAKQKDAPRPTGSYADVSIVNNITLGWEQRTLKNNTGDEDLTETIEGMRELMFSIGFYRDGSIDNAEKARIGFIRESIQELFGTAGIGLTRRSEVRSISEALENGWEERAQFDIVLSAVGSDSDIVTSILAVDIAGAFQARGLEYNFTIEVQ